MAACWVGVPAWATQGWYLSPTPISSSRQSLKKVVWWARWGCCSCWHCLPSSGLRAALRAPDTFRRYLATGLVTYLVAQAVLIIAGNIRLLPLTGVTLPFVSYGGSSLLTAYISLLILLRISNRAEEDPQPLPRDASTYLHLAAFLFIGLVGAGLVTGWWAFVRGPDLLTRTDNPRRAFADQYVQRGAILDRNNGIISASSGEPGEYVRSIIYPPLSGVVGYTHPVYGQAGLEASLDEYLPRPAG